MNQNAIYLGIDIGSTTVKIAILDENHQILFSDYKRRFSPNFRRLFLTF